MIKDLNQIKNATTIVEQAVYYVRSLNQIWTHFFYTHVAFTNSLIQNIFYEL